MLIAQFSKNFTNDYNKLVSGDELLTIAMDKVKRLQRESGGKWVYLECEDTQKLVDFYRRNGFVNIGLRKLDASERGLSEAHCLVQMMKYLSDNNRSGQ